MTGSPRGRLIALEGIDGSGKSTQAVLLADRLGAVCTFEPGATVLGKALRELMLRPGRPPVARRTEALLMVADRAQHVDEVVLPALASGRWVVTDRFTGSTLAYQGFGRGMDRVRLARLVAWATDDLTPDLTILVDVEPDVAIRRRPEATDHFEGLDLDFHRRVADGFRRLAAAERESWAVVDGAASIDDVAAAVWGTVRDRLGEGPSGE